MTTDPKGPQPVLSWLKERSAGVLLHPSSLPSGQGIGTFAAESRAWVDWLADSGLRYWQMLPLGPTGFGDSPYQTFSAFALNPYWIDIEALVALGLLEAAELEPLHALPRERVDYGGLYHVKPPLLRLAWMRFEARGEASLGGEAIALEAFAREHASWLEPYTAFMALKRAHHGQSWLAWPQEQCSYAAAQAHGALEALDDERRAQTFFQYVAHVQFGQLRAYAQRRGVELIGDLPIFVALDSADVWAQPELFLLGEDGRPTHVAGVPPDYFSPTGQLWGNPLYDWSRHARDGYAWWLDRLRQSFGQFSAVRLDHFRGFHDYWAIPAGAEDARAGVWMPGPDRAFFEAVAAALPGAQLIAEDLGDLSPGVLALRDAAGLPGMQILHFAFDGNPGNGYLPHQSRAEALVYPGVHDNDTTRGWYDSLDEAARDQLRRYLRVSGEDIAWDLIRACYRDVARLALIPAQDLLGLGSEARMNRPGLAQGNWQWRLTRDQMEALHGHSPALRELAWLYGREVARTNDATAATVAPGASS